MNYYRRYVGSYLKKTSRLSMLEHGAYNLLLDYYYADERPLPGNYDEIYSLVRAMKTDEKKAVDKVLAAYFTLEADGFHQAKADEELCISTKMIEVARENGKLGGRPPKKTQTQTRDETQTITQKKPAQEPATQPRNNHPSTSNLQPSSASRQPSTKSSSGESASSTAREGPKAAPPEEKSESKPAQRTEITEGPAFDLAEKFIALGVAITANDPRLPRWIEAGITFEIAERAVTKIRTPKRKPAGPIPANYLAPIVDELLHVELKGEWPGAETGRGDPRCSGVLADMQRCEKAAILFPGRSKKGFCRECYPS